MDDRHSDIRRMLEEIVRTLVDAPESVSVQDFPTSGGTLLRLHVAPPDVPRVIGRQGRTARSLRTILATFSVRANHHYTLDIAEGE